MSTIVEAIIFVLSAGVLFGDRFSKRNHPIRVIAGAIAALSMVAFVVQTGGILVNVFSNTQQQPPEESDIAPTTQLVASSGSINQSSAASLPGATAAMQPPPATRPPPAKVSPSANRPPSASTPADAADTTDNLPEHTAPQQGAGPVDPAATIPFSTPADLGRSLERNGIYVVLNSIGESESRYAVGLTVVNENPTDIGVALVSNRVFTAEAYLTDADGDSCQLAQNGEGWGSLSAFMQGSANLGARYSLVPANGSMRETLYFNKGRCGGAVIKDDGVSVGATLLISRNGHVFEYPISFNIYK